MHSSLEILHLPSYLERCSKADVETPEVKIVGHSDGTGALGMWEMVPSGARSQGIRTCLFPFARTLLDPTICFFRPFPGACLAESASLFFEPGRPQLLLWIRLTAALEGCSNTMASASYGS